MDAQCAPYLIRMLQNAQTNVRTFGNYGCWSFKNICVVCQLEAENFCCSLQMEVILLVIKN